MKSIRTLLALVTIVTFGITSCSKTGETGPAGPAGPTGPDSVFSSPWISLSPVGYVDSNSDSAWDQTITAASITKKILDSGVILTYVNIATPGSGDYFVKDVSSLPNLFYEDFSVGSLYLNAGFDFSTLPFRYVTIPGNLVAGNGASRKVKGYTITELKAMGYEKVMQVLKSNN
jgi:hypothetical protein